MSARTFHYGLAALGLLILLSATEFPGAIVGFFCGVAIAFFVAGPSFLLASALGVDARIVIYALVACYGLLVLAMVALTASSWRTQAPEVARVMSLKTALFLSLPLVFLLSSQALVRAWP